MPQLNRMYCSNCKTSIYNVMVDGVRVPYVFYFVVGQPPDTGPQLDVNAEGVKVPSFIRAILQAPVPRAELCMNCVADIFGVPLVTAKEDPMYSDEQFDENTQAIREVMQDESVDQVNTNAAIMERPLLAIKVGRGAVDAPALPPAKKVESPADPAAADVAA